MAQIFEGNAITPLRTEVYYGRSKLCSVWCCTCNALAKHSHLRLCTCTLCFWSLTLIKQISVYHFHLQGVSVWQSYQRDWLPDQEPLRDYRDTRWAFKDSRLRWLFQYVTWLENELMSHALWQGRASASLKELTMWLTLAVTVPSQKNENKTDHADSIHLSWTDLENITLKTFKTSLHNECYEQLDEWLKNNTNSGAQKNKTGANTQMGKINGDVDAELWKAARLKTARVLSLENSL